FAVADGKAHRAGQPRLGRERTQDAAAGVARVLLLAAGEISKCDSDHLLEDSRQTQVRPHSVESIGTLTHVLQHQHRALERRKVRRAEQPSKDGEISTDERTFYGAGDQSRGAFQRSGELGRLEELKKAVHGTRRLTPELSDNWTVDGDPACGVEGEVERRD